MSTPDYYSILGVLPSAEDVVIAAAYRALAQRYHPDKWEGASSDAHEKMSAINEAYGVLRDQARRAEYDRSRERTDQAEFSSNESRDFSEAFASALAEVEDRWKIACSIYSDLGELRKTLSTISTSLAFAYVTALLEMKEYASRHEIAASLANAFLRRYFGDNERIIQYAHGLIFSGQREAARALNRLVDVMGSGIDPSLLITKIDNDFGLKEARVKAAREEQKQRDRDQLTKAVEVYGHYKEARALADLHGYQSEEVGGGLLTSPEVHVKTPWGAHLAFSSSTAFIQWVKNTLLP